MKVKVILSLCLGLVINLSMAQSTYYEVYSGDGNGVRFWQSDLYKIHMGNGSEYHLGPVTDYSIKMNMNNTAGRGWTWGISGATPIAALNNAGQMQVTANLYVGPYIPASALVGAMSVSGSGAGLSFSNRAVSSYVATPTQGERWVIYNDGTATDGKLKFWTGGEKVTFTKEGMVGIGTTTPQQPLDVVGDARMSSRLYFSAANAYTNGSYAIVGIHTGVAGKNMVFYNYDGPVNELMTLNGTTGSAAINNGGLTVSGNVGIGTTIPGAYKLAVEGKIGAREINVTTGAWSDYVFNKNYKLRPLSEVREFIDEHHHLPDVPSEKEVLANGQNLGEMNAILLKKVEELTLYVIELREDNDNLKKRVESIERKK